MSKDKSGGCGGSEGVRYFENGKLASRFAENGTGFIYYPNGAVAFCSSEASDYQNRYFAFDKDRKNTLLLSLDEHGIGFISGSKRKLLKGTSPECALTKAGGIITSPEGRITNQWKWDPKAQNSGNPPQEAVLFRLNEHLLCRFKNRFEVSLDFEYDAIRFQFDLGIKFKRSDSYLDHAKRTLDGKLIPQIPHTTLRERQAEFSEQMSAQRNKVHPRSENLSSMVQGIVSALEENFDTIGSTLKLPTADAATWKTEALSRTLNEIPKIELTGVETGIESGFSKEIYTNKGDSLERTAPKRLVTETGEWKDSLAMRTTIREENPPLSRKSAILKASGRYSDMLVVDPAAVTSDNPTGMVEVGGLPLPHVRWETLKNTLRNEDGGNFTVALALRPGDPICCSYLRIAELVHQKLHDSQSQSSPFPSRAGSSSPSRPSSATIQHRVPRMVQIDVSQNSAVVTELGIKTLPLFLMFQGQNLVYGGSIGGRKIKLDSSHKPQVLLIESNFKDQITCEKTLRKVGCEPFLCLSFAEAVNRIQQLSNPSPDRSGRLPDPVIFDLILISEEIESDNLMLLRKVLKDVTKDNRTIVALLVSVLGEFGRANLNAVRWDSGCSSEVTSFSRRDLSDVCSVAIQKPIKQHSIEKLLTMRTLPQNESNFGATPDSLEAKIQRIQSEALNGTRPPIEYIGIRLASQDTKMRNGRDLTSS